MKNPTIRTQSPLPGERGNNLVAEVFRAATITLVGVMGLLTIAASI